MNLDSFKFRHFRTRILVFVLTLLILIQNAIFLAVNSVNTQNAHHQIDQALQLTRGLFYDALETRKRRLQEKIRLLSSDYAFKKAFSSGDIETILSVLENHQARVSADVMMLLTFEEGDIIADTSSTTTMNKTNSKPFYFPELLSQAFNSEQGEGSAIKLFNKLPHQFVLVPLFTPEPNAWIVIAYSLKDQFTHQIQAATQTHVTLFDAKNSALDLPIFASTLPSVKREALADQRHMINSLTKKDIFNQSSTLVLDDEPYISLVVPIDTTKSSSIFALLQRPLNKALEAYLGIRKTFVFVFIFALIASVIGILFIARSVTRPVRVLVASAKRIEHGDYTTPVAIKQRDELGRLAHSFNKMMKGLAERRQVRSLLGKVVSPAIADELLKKDIELGGEERKVTMLFSDIRNFTSLCEGRAPKDILDFLNTYLTSVSDVIEKHQGVIDKYIGDAVMALYGAPIQRTDDESRAILSAMEMCTALDAVNIELKKTNKPLLAVGVGINTDIVVAGNMGSKARLNYTVIGDGVNLASRLEGLTKQYGVEIIVSESTKQACPDFIFRELDKVRVKGKSDPVIIFEPISLTKNLNIEQSDELQRYKQALNWYRQQQWQEALKGFNCLIHDFPQIKLYKVYQERTTQYISNPPSEDWDGTYTFTTK